MNPALIIALVEGGIALLESMAAKGEVTPEKVAEIKAKAKASESFEEWLSVARGALRELALSYDTTLDGITAPTEGNP